MSVQNSSKVNYESHRHTLLKMYAKIIISCGYELFCDKIEASFLVRSFGCAFFVFIAIKKYVESKSSV